MSDEWCECDVHTFIAALKPALSVAGVAVHVRSADICIVGPVDGMNELHPEGSYFRLVAARGDDEHHQFLLSCGAAETLRDELIGVLAKDGGRTAEGGVAKTHTEGSIKVTISDLATDKVLEERILQNDYAIICAGNRYVKNIQIMGRTHMLAVVVSKSYGER